MQAGDYLAAALLIISPFALGYTDSDGGLAAFYVAVLAVSMLTNYQYSPAGVGRRDRLTTPDDHVVADGQRLAAVVVALAPLAAGGPGPGEARPLV